MSKELPEDEIFKELESLHNDFFKWSMYCCHFQSEVAEEVLQNAYLKFLKSIDAFDRNRNLKVYFFTIIKNCSYDFFQKSNRVRDQERSFENEALFLKSASQELKVQQQKDQQKIQNVLKSLSKREAEIINLVIYQGMTVVEAAEIMGVTQGSASSYYKRGKAKFKEEIIRNHYQDKTSPPKFEDSLTLGLELIKVKYKK